MMPGFELLIPGSGFVRSWELGLDITREVRTGFELWSLGSGLFIATVLTSLGLGLDITTVVRHSRVYTRAKNVSLILNTKLPFFRLKLVVKNFGHSTKYTI